MHDMIYCQRGIPKDELRYGLRTSAATGCGWIATYNALRILGKRADKAPGSMGMVRRSAHILESRASRPLRAIFSTAAAWAAS